MNLSRRDILKGAAASLLTGASSMAITPALAGAGRRGPGGTPATGVDELSRASFAAAVGTDFHVHLSAMRTPTVRLERVTDLVPPSGSPAPAPGREGFTLVFAGEARGAFGQGTYTLDSARLGSFALMLVPAGRTGSVSRYEAVINRLWP